MNDLMFVQAVCENHEWVEVTQTTYSTDAVTTTATITVGHQCRLCGIVKPVINPDSIEE